MPVLDLSINNESNYGYFPNAKKRLRFDSPNVSINESLPQLDLSLSDNVSNPSKRLRFDSPDVSLNDSLPQLDLSFSHDDSSYENLPRLDLDNHNDTSLPILDLTPDVAIINQLTTEDQQLFEKSRIHQRIQSDNELYKRYKHSGLKVRFPKGNRLINPISNFLSNNTPILVHPYIARPEFLAWDYNNTNAYKFPSHEELDNNFDTHHIIDEYCYNGLVEYYVIRKQCYIYCLPSKSVDSKLIWFWNK